VADFQLYLQYLYTGRMATLDHNDTGTSSMTLVRLYVLGDYLGDNRFCNNVIDALIGRSVLVDFGMVFSSAALDLAWEKTTPGSILRKVLLEVMMCNLSSIPFPFFFEDMGAWSKEVSVDVFRHMTGYPCIQDAIKAAERNIGGEISDMCSEYHRHGEGEPKCSVH
jgi:hypothetical protein